MTASFLKLGSLEDLTEMLWADGPSILLIAGGTDVLVRQRPFADKPLVIDISQMAELQGIGMDEEGLLRVGAGVTHQQVADDPLVRRRAYLLKLACASVGSAQIRNRGTIGGNLGNASPAADSVPALACLDAQVVLVSRGRRRMLPVLSLFEGPGKTMLNPDELLESVRIPLRPGRTVAFFKKIGQRRSGCCSKASVAFYARSHEDGRLSGVRVAMGAVAPTVVESPEAAGALEGRILSPAVIRQAAQACGQATRAIDDIRSTAEYRRRVVGALLTEGLLVILDRTPKSAEKGTHRVKKRLRSSSTSVAECCHHSATHCMRRLQRKRWRRRR